MKISGEILSGEFDQQNDAFTLQQVKHHSTTSTLTKAQFHAIYEYLHEHKNEPDGQVLSLNDQLLVRLTQEELNHFVEDMERIQPLYQ